MNQTDGPTRRRNLYLIEGPPLSTHTEYSIVTRPTQSRPTPNFPKPPSSNRSNIVIQPATTQTHP